MSLDLLYLFSNLSLLTASVLTAYTCFNTRERKERVLAAVEWGIWIFFFVVLVVLLNLGALPSLVGLGHLRLLSSGYAAAFLLLAAGSLLWISRRHASAFWADSLHLLARTARSLSSLGLLVPAACLVASLAIGLYKTVMFPPFLYDELTYHLLPLPEWHRLGTLPVKLPFEAGEHMGAVNRELLGGSLLNLWGFWFFNNIFLVELYPFLMTVALAIGLFRLFSLLKLPKPTALLFCAVVVSSPCVVLNIHACKNYVTYIYPWCSAAFLLAQQLKTPRRKELVLLAPAVAIAWSAKIVSIAILPLLAGMFLLFKVGRDGVRGLRRSIFPGIGVAVLCVVAIVSSSWFWTYRNIINEGVYFYRIKEGLSGGVTSGGATGEKYTPHGFTGGQSLFHKYLDVLYTNVREYPERVRDLPHEYLVTEQLFEYNVGSYAISNFGILYYSVGQVFAVVFAFLVLSRGRVRREQRPLCFLFVTCLSTLLLHFLVYYNPWSYRAHLFVPLLVMPVSLWALFHCLGRKLHFHARSLLLLGVVYNLAVCTFAENTTDTRRIWVSNLPLGERSVALYYSDWDLMNTTGEPRTEALVAALGARPQPAGEADMESYFYPMNLSSGTGLLPNDAVVAALATASTQYFYDRASGKAVAGLSNYPLFPLFDPELKRQVIPVTPVEYSQPEGFGRLLESRGVDFVFLGFETPGPNSNPLRLSLIPGTTYLAIVNQHWKPERIIRR